MTRWGKRTKHFVIACILYSVGLIALTAYSNFIYDYRLPVVTFVFPEPGSIVEEGTAEEQYYGTVIPAEALQKDKIGYYVLVVQKDESVLGYGYEARRRSVDLLGTDEKYCAVSGLASDDQVIVVASGDITDGSDVSIGKKYKST